MIAFPEYLGQTAVSRSTCFGDYYKVFSSVLKKKKRCPNVDKKNPKGAKENKGNIMSTFCFCLNKLHVCEDDSIHLQKTLD